MLAWLAGGCSACCPVVQPNACARRSTASIRPPHSTPRHSAPTPLCPLCSYWDQGAEKRAQVGIRDNLIRFSCGIESAEDIWADFEQAFDRL